ncbi:TPA: hypothetical protein JBD38_14055 [Legionella pneumophila subsp. pneumophila]|nr:hypothetical protein [Legionella pneumophila]MDW8922589.1 hypothetical protein [Legionella pneumophila]MDW8928726.1 hypothetical protein [Legionella pneumophila]MDX1866554.1 hypothetical protein [Legionella pneumophila]HAT9621496.1 hypothetical protein [Legionella pneumophila subsp. pneumophila]
MLDNSSEELLDEVIYLPPKPHGLILDHNKIQYKNKQCMLPACDASTVKCHVISKSSIRQYARGNIANLNMVYRDPYFLIKPKDNWQYFKPLDLDKHPTFLGFCNTHDNDLFKELDHYNGNMTPRIALLAHYRVLCYGLNTIQLELKQHNFLKQASYVGGSTKLSKEIARKLQKGYYERRLKWAEDDYLYRKSLCEQAIFSANEKAIINYVRLRGNVTNPLFFGRGGVFLHAYNKPQIEQQKLPARFMSQMPYIMYFTICHNDKVDLYFSFLTLDKEQYAKDLDCFLDENDLSKRLEILISAHSDCCILQKDCSPIWQDTIKQLIDFNR